MTSSHELPACLILVRHGETVGNQQQLWTGWSDTALSKVGREQVCRTVARLERDSLGVVGLYSSPTGRAWKTALSFGQVTRLHPVRDESLREMHFGELEAIRSEHFQADHPEVYARWQDRTDEGFCWPAGESRSQFRARVRAAVLRLAGAHLGETILLVTHSGFIRMALAHLMPHRFGEWWNVRIDNCSFTHLLVDRDAMARVPTLNDISHLAD
jgi:broad specificity phosphatase PhoE